MSPILNSEKEYYDIEDKIINEINNICSIIKTDYKEIAEIIGTDQAYIHKVLNKKKHLTLHLFLRICLALQEINKNRNFPFDGKELLPSRVLYRTGL